MSIPMAPFDPEFAVAALGWVVVFFGGGLLTGFVVRLMRRGR